MSRHGFRFVHATSLCLDEHLTGTGALTSEDRQLLEDATFLAWEQIVETAIRAQVEFVLLTGNSFNAKNNSLRARVALERGFDLLKEHHISVFAVPGRLDPVIGWKRNIQLPSNVTLLTADDHEPIQVLRDDKLIASISVIATPDSQGTRWSDSNRRLDDRQRASFRIGMVSAGTPIDWVNGKPVPIVGERPDQAKQVQSAIDLKTCYIALGEGVTRTVSFPGGLAHDPGCAQSLSAAVTGSRGCSVINVDEFGEVMIDKVAVAPVRWEDLSITLEPHHHLADLSERMALALMELTPDNDERLWIVTWKLNGAGTLFDTLGAPEKQQELWNKLEKELTGERAVRRLHRLERNIVGSLDEALKASGETRLMSDFQEILNQHGEEFLEQIRKEILEQEWIQHHDTKMIRESLMQISKPAVYRRAKSIASQWLE